MSIIEDAVNQANVNYFSQATSEANLERRCEEIKRIAAESMQEGGEFYPYEPKNFDEALQNMPKEVLGEIARSAAMVDEARSAGCDAIFMQGLKVRLADELSIAIFNYWADVAAKVAAKNYIN